MASPPFVPFAASDSLVRWPKAPQAEDGTENGAVWRFDRAHRGPGRRDGWSTEHHAQRHAGPRWATGLSKVCEPHQNSMVMMLELEMEGRAVGFILGHEATAIGISGLGDGSTWSLADVEPTFQGLLATKGTGSWGDLLDTAFVYIFLLELLLRILAEGRQFFRDCANWFDTVLVIVGLVDVWIIVPFASGGGTSDPQNIMMMRLFRAVKCLRAIRMVRTFRLFRGLNLLVKACQCFLPSLGWSMVLLVVFMSMGTLIMGNLLRLGAVGPPQGGSGRSGRTRSDQSSWGTLKK
eukprot:g6236.t1